VKVSAGVILMSLLISIHSPAWAQTAPGLAETPQASKQDSANELFVAVGKSVLIDIAKPVQRISVGLGDVAEATAVSPAEILVNGKTAGDTSLIVWEAGGGRQFYNVVVRPSEGVANDRLEGVRRELRTELPGQSIRVSSENGQIFLRGTVKDLTSSARAVQIASTVGKVVNLLFVDVPSSEPQILLKVRFASVDRSVGRQLGINIFSLGAANTIGSITTQQFPPPVISSPGATTGPTATLSDLMNLFIFRPDLNLGATIKALETEGVLQVLAEPNVLAMNGKQAGLLAGGEYPYPVVQGVTGGGTGAVTIQFKEYGIRLNFIPTVTPRNTIRLQVAPEVSALDFANGVSISGFRVPGITVRRVKTDVELSQGQSFAIGGLLDNRETQTFSKIPFIGDVPILGRFFQSIDRTKSNTELIVIVTPEIVAPIPAGAPLPQPNFPIPFLPPNSNQAMMNPDATVTGAKPLPAASNAIPVEKLIESMQPEQPLVTDNGYGATSYGMGQGSSGTGNATTTPASP
jgi:pilus assembly protein CpaC